MPEDLHGDARVNVERGQQRPACMPGVMDPDAADACFGAPGVEGAAEVAGLDRCSLACSEDQAQVLPRRGGRGPGSVLLLTPDLERGLGSRACAKGPGLPLPPGGCDLTVTNNLGSVDRVFREGIPREAHLLSATGSIGSGSHRSAVSTAAGRSRADIRTAMPG